MEIHFGWLQRVALHGKHTLFASRGIGLSYAHIAVDVMHSCDLGITQHICGSVIYLLVFDTGLPHGPGRRMDTLQKVWGLIHEAYSRLGTPAGECLRQDLFMAIFENSKTRLPTTYPQLHAKSAVARHCVAALLLVVRDLHKWVPAYDADNTVFGHATELLEGFEQVLYCNYACWHVA